MSSFLPLSILRSCFIPSIHLARTSFSNPPCFCSWSFWLFYSFFLTTPFFFGMVVSSFLFFSCWFWFGVLLRVVVPIFCFTWTFLLSFSFWCVWWTNSGEAWFFCLWESLNLLMPKGGFSCGKNGKKKQVKQRDAGVCSIKSEMR